MDGGFTTVADAADAVLFFASSPTDALTGRWIIVGHNWSME